MLWAWISLASYGLFAALAFGLRSFVQYRRTGSSGFRVMRARGVQRVVGVVTGIAMTAWLMTPVSAVLGRAAFFNALDIDALHIAGLVIGSVGIIVAISSQFAMGDSWRIGVDVKERTALVTHGPFRWVRNPIYTGLLIFAAGNILVTPTWPAIISFLMLLLSVEMQVRHIEEPYLLDFHGGAYLAWAARTGRFIPGLGRLSV
jgi:protein-S-isoprenylcysteine O-methyltransferase Ste14